MKRIYILLILCCTIVACKKVEVGFTYSPTDPRTGEVVQFTNQSNAGEEWEWQFGDGSVSTLKSPSHTYKKSGTFLVLLTIDKKKNLRASKEITIVDSVPTFTVNDSVFYIFRDYTFTANVYNPYNLEISYEWLIDGIAYGTDPMLTTYFEIPDDSVEVKLNLTLATDTFTITKHFFIEDQEVRSVTFRTEDGDYRQRIFGTRAEIAIPDDSATPLLDAEQDTAQTYNGYDFRLSELRTVFPEMEGFHIANRKIYFRADGLWVANIDGANIVQIDSTACTAMTLDAVDSRIYWANEEGIWYMPFIGSDNNRFVSIPVQLNNQQAIKIAIDNELQ